jgi:hypothetical protein
MRFGRLGGKVWKRTGFFILKKDYQAEATMEFERYYIELLEMLNFLCKKIAAENYTQDDVDKLFELAKTNRYPGIFAELAESFGMMMVKLEAREFHLKQTIEAFEKEKWHKIFFKELGGESNVHAEKNPAGGCRDCRLGSGRGIGGVLRHGIQAAGMAEGPVRHRFKKMLAIMIKVRDGLDGRVNPDETFSKPIDNDTWWRLNKGAVLAEDILLKAGVRREKIVKTSIIASHPGGTVRIGNFLDNNCQTPIKNCYCLDTTIIPEAWGLPPTVTVVAMGKRLAKHLSTLI